MTSVHVDVTTVPTNAGSGSAFPANLYHVALLRWGDAVGYFDAVPVVGGPQWLAVPAGTTRLGYACQFGAVISVVEVIGGTPPFGGAGALSTLSDVALASPADTQVLTYQASSSKWINAAAPGGGGGSATLTTATAALASLVNCPTAGTYYDGPSVSLAAGTWFLSALVTLYNNTGGISIATAKVWNGTTVYVATETITRDGTQNYSLALSAIVVLAASTTVKISVAWNNNNGRIAAATANNGAPSPATIINALKVA